MPEDYPFSPPQVKFHHELCHLNMAKFGKPCIYSLTKDNWAPALQMRIVILILHNFFKDPDPDNFMDEKLVNLYNKDKKFYGDYVKSKCKQNLRNF